MTEKQNPGKLTHKFSEAASTDSGRVHVVPGRDGWSVKREGATRSSAVRKTRDGAVKVAREMAMVKQVVVHRKDGTIQRGARV